MAKWKLELSTAATADPVTVAECKAHLNIVGTDDDDVIQKFLSAAVADYQHATNRQLINASYKLYLDRFHDRILLPRPPLSSVTSVKYLDTDGNEQTLATANYDVHAVSKDEPGEVTLAYDYTWPATRDYQRNTVTIEYVAGYGASSTNVPEKIRHVIRNIVSVYDRFRDPVVTQSPQIGIAALVHQLCMPTKTAFENPWP